MAHYAFVNENNIVTEVIPGKDETELIDGLNPEQWYGDFRGQRCIRTSYNSNIRKHFAGIGMEYRDDLDAFIPIKCHDEAILNESECIWECENTEHEATFD